MLQMCNLHPSPGYGDSPPQGPGDVELLSGRYHAVVLRGGQHQHQGGGAERDVEGQGQQEPVQKPLLVPSIVPDSVEDVTELEGRPCGSSSAGIRGRVVVVVADGTSSRAVVTHECCFDCC